MPLQLGTKIRSGYVIAFILLLVTYFLIFYSVKNLAAGTQNISVTHNLINKVEALQVSMMDAESSVRSFIINPDPNLLNRYYAAQREIPILRTGIQNLNIQNNA